MNKKKIFIIIVIMLAFILVGVSCTKTNDDDTKDYLVYLLAKDAGYEGTNDDFKKLVNDIEIKNITKVYINEKGELIVVLNDNSERNYGIVKEDVKIETIELNSLGELVITYSNSKTKNLGNVISRDGLDLSKGSQIKSVSIDMLGELVITYENKKSKVLGIVYGKNNNLDGIKDIDMNDSLEVILTYNDKTVKNLGNILISLNEEKIYTVKFQSFTDIVLEIKVSENSLLGLPNIDKVKGYRLIGWYNETKEWNFASDLVTSDMTLIARYEEVEEIEPVYQGMTIVGDLTKKERRNKDNKTDIKDAIDDFLDVITSEKVDYYASKGEKFYIVIHLYNPTEYEILSFTLNDRKYQSFEFKDGSNSTQLIIEVDAGMKPGLKEYTIDGIKYIDKTEIKDVRMDGSKTIKAGIKYDVLPNATVVKEEVTTTTYQSIFEIKDENQLINKDTGLYYFLYDGKSIVYNQKLSLGANSVVYENLQMGSEYEYMVVGIYDDFSGAGKKAVSLASSKFKTLDGFLIEEETASKDEITLKINKETEKAQIQEISLYDGEQKVQSTNSFDSIKFTNLLSNHNYLVRITYTYMFDEILRTKTLEREIDTLSKEKPAFEINELVSGKRTISYEVSDNDIDNVIIAKEYNLKLNGDVVRSANTKIFTFDNLLTNNTYDLEVIYTYDLNDGMGKQTITETKTIKTQAYSIPLVGIKITELTDNVISGDINLSDIDNIFNLIDIKLMQDGNLLNTITDTMHFDFDVNSNIDYVIIVDYTYDLNDGSGIVQGKYEYKVRTNKEIPIITFTPYHISDNSIEYNLLISDNNVSGRLNLIALYEGFTFITKYDEINTKIEGLKSNTEYTLKINYVYDFDDGYGSRELTKEYTFKTLKQEPTYSLEFSNISKHGFDLIHNINDKDNALTFKEIEISLNNRIMQTVTNFDLLEVDNLFADNNYKVVVKFEKDLNNGIEEIVYTSFIKAKAYDKPTVDINLESNKTEISYSYEINDPFKMSEIKDISLYYQNQKVDRKASLNTFSELYSNLEYTVRVTLLNNYFDGKEKREEVYEKQIRTKPLNAPSVSLDFSSKVDSIKYNIKKIDIDNILNIEKIDVYENDILVQTITDFDKQLIENLNSNTVYKFIVTYKYNLNDQTDDIENTVEYNFSTLSYSVNIKNISVLNETSPKTNEDVNIKLYLDNISKVKIQYLVINGEKTMISGGSEIEDVIVIVRAPKMSGLMNLNIEKMGYIINDVTVEQDIEGTHSFDVQIFSRLDIIDISLVNGTNFDKYPSLGYVITIDNPYGYIIKSIEFDSGTLECIMIDNNHLYLNEYGSRISAIYYTDENDNNCVRNYTQYLETDFKSYMTDSLTNSLTIKQVSTPSDFMNMKDNYIYELANDIDMEGYSWNPYLFGGYFDGKGHTIKNLTYIHEDRWAEGFNPEISNILGIGSASTFENVYFENIYIDIDTTTVSYGETYILYPYGENAKIENVLFSGFINFKVNGVQNTTFAMPSDTCYIVDHLTVNNTLYSQNNLISYETFNSNEFKTQVLKWVFKEKEIKNLNGLLYTIIDNSYIMITGYNGTDSLLEIPSRIDGLRVVGIEDLAFAHNKTIKKLIIPENLLTLGSSVCTGCSNLESLVIRNTKLIKDYCLLYYIFGAREYDNSYCVSGYTMSTTFYAPNSLEELEINSNTVDDRTLYLEGLTSLEKLTVKGNIINSPVCAQCNNLKEVILLDNIQNISEKSFAFCDGLTDVSLSENVKTIRCEAFWGCNKLSNINLPDSIIEIENGVFFCCNELKNITLPKNITIINDNLFQGCYNLKNIAMPDSITRIGNGAFNNCRKLVLSKLPDSLTTIGDAAFYVCEKLENLIIPDNVSKIGSHAFASCSNLKIVVLPKGLKEIPSAAFNCCTKLTSVTMPEKLEKIGNSAFSRCSNLKTIEIPEGIKIIGDYAFSGAPITEINFPESLCEIRTRAFDGGIIPIIVIPKNVKVIGENAFTSYKVYSESDSMPAGWDDNFCSYTDFEIEWGLIGHIVQDDICYGIKDDYAIVIKINSRDSVIPDYIDFNGTSYPVMEIGSHAALSVESIILPKTLTKIGKQAFAGSMLKEIVIPENVTDIEDHAFSSNGKLESVVINGPITELNEYTFSGCTNLKNISLPDTLISIYGCCFHDCKSLNNIIFPKKLKYIGENILRGAYSLMAVAIPESVEIIETPFKEGGLFIFCEASEKPSGWADGWDFNCTVKWNVSVIDIASIGGVIYAITENYAIIASPPADDSGYPSEVEYKGKKYTVIP